MRIIQWQTFLAHYAMSLTMRNYALTICYHMQPGYG